MRGQRHPAGVESTTLCSSTYRGEVTAAGAPSEDLLDSAEQERRARSRPWAVPVGVLLLVMVGLFGFQALQPDPAAEAPQPSAISAIAATDPAIVDASARRLNGELPPTGAQGFASALRAATDVVGIHCREDIPSWAARLINSGDGYDQATFVMSPANRTYGTFVVQVELTWTVDHFNYAVVAGHVERCA